MLRYLHFFRRAKRLSMLGARYQDRARIFLSYCTLSIRRLMGLPYAALPLAKVKLRFEGKEFPFYYRGLLDFYILEGVFLENDCETHPASPPRTIFDLGSNTGATVLYFKLKYPEARIFAFEPDPENIAVLRKNVEWFKNDVTIFEGAVSGTSVASVDFYIGKEHWSSSLASRSGSDRRISVEMITIDDAMKRYGVDHIDILKFDVEGAEYEIFKNFKRFECAKELVGEVHLDLLGSNVEAFWQLFSEFSILRRPEHNQRLTAVFKRT